MSLPVGMYDIPTDFTSCTIVCYVYTTAADYIHPGKKDIIVLPFIV